jgi:hypothetical protein
MGVCSWDFALDGDGDHATLKFNWGSEQGSLTTDGMCFEVRKHGAFSGHWTLEREGARVASAQKSDALTRKFEIEDCDGRYVLHPEVALGRGFLIECSSNVVAAVRPDHALTRRSTIETFAEDCEFATTAFAFWLVALTWRRDAES